MIPAYGETVTVRRATPGTDGYGDATITDWTGSVTDTAVTGCILWPTSSSEFNVGRTEVTIGLQLVVPAGTDIRATDRVVWRGEVYEVDGQPFPWKSPFTGWQPGTQVALVKAAG